MLDLLSLIVAVGLLFYALWIVVMWAESLTKRFPGGVFNGLRGRLTSTRK